MKKILLFAICILSLQVFADTGKYRVMFNTDPSTAATIGWNQVSGNNPTVYYDVVDHGTNFGAYAYSNTADRTVSYKGMTNTFANLAGLQPNTAYYFVIADSEGNSERFWFMTAPNIDSERLSFIAGGDSRNNRTPRQNANRLVSKLRPHAVFFGGDMTNSDTDTQWKDWFDDWQLTFGSDGRITPIVAARGNHEGSNRSISDLFDTNEEVYFAVTFGGGLIRTYTLNTESSITGAQTTWLENDLANNPNTDWKMAQYHKPMRPHQSGKSEGNNQYNSWAVPFYENNVRLVVECDAHVVKTTWPVKPDASGDEGFVRDNENGTVFIGEGCWGAPTRSNDDDKTWTRASESFDQIKWIFIDKYRIEARTLKVANASLVQQVDDNNRFAIPANLDVWNPGNGSGDVVVIEKPTNPVINITAPTNKEFIGSPQAYTISTEANDLNGTVDSVEFFVNGNKVGVKKVAPWSFDYNFQNAGTFIIDVIATDNEGKTGMAAPVNFFVNNYTVTNTGRIAYADDDMEEGDDGTMINEASIQLVNNTTAGDQTVGFRFQNMSIPKGATITSTYIQFTVESFSFGTSDLTIQGDKNPESTTFNLSSNNISSRTKTTNSATWAPVNWFTTGEASTDQQTPDLSALLQEMVNQENWTAASAPIFIFTGTGTKNIVGYEGDPTASAQLIIEFSYAATPPVATITSPSNGLTFHGLNEINIQAMASDLDGTIDYVEFIVNGVSIGKDLDSNYSQTFIPSIGGSYSLQAIARDNEGTLDTSDVINLLVNLTPNVEITAPTTGSIITQPQALDITTNATDADGTVTKVEFYINNVLNYTATTAPFTFNWDIPNGGEYTITTIATDDNEGTDTSESKTITVNTPPSAKNDSVSILEDEASVFNVLANDIDTDNDSLLISIITSPKNGAASVNGSFIDYLPTADFYGIDSIQYQICDAYICDTAWVKIIISSVNDAPVAEISNPINGSQIEINTIINFSVIATDDDSVAMVEYYLNSTFEGLGEVSNNFQLSFQTGVPDTYSVYAIVTDNQGLSTITDTAVFEATSSVGIRENNNPQNIVISPNPTTNFITLTNGKSKQKVSIVNLDGKLILAEILNGKNDKLDVTKLPNGSYIIQVTKRGKVIYSNTLVKN